MVICLVENSIIYAVKVVKLVKIYEHEGLHVCQSLDLDYYIGIIGCQRESKGQLPRRKIIETTKTGTSISVEGMPHSGGGISWMPSTY